MGRSRGCLLLLLLGLAACSSEEAETETAPVDLSPLGGERPVEPIAPSGIDATTPLPLVILLHGFGASGLANDLLLQLEDRVEDRRFVLLRPDGTVDRDGKRFWNATDACCDRYGTGIDDVAYITGLIAEARARFAIQRVALIGHSNGGFMSHRFACDRAEDVDAIASLAGSTWADPSPCQPSEPVRVLQMHGTLDETVPFEGVATASEPLGAFPGAVETVARWADLNGCGATPEPGSPMDLSDAVDGPETEPSRHPGCPAGAAAELWAMVGEGHIPVVNDAWRDAVLDFLLLPDGG